MPATTVRGSQVRDATIQRVDLDTATAGQAVIAKAVQGQGIKLTATGADAGTGDVTMALAHEFDTGLTGGGTSNLDGEATTSLAVGNNFRYVVVSGSLSIWQLVAGTDAESISGGVVRPDDYNGSTNAKVWKRVLGL